MALWFAELACRDRLQSIGNSSRTHQRNPYATRQDRASQHVVRLYDADIEQLWVSL
jgi:hypothetical protein